MGARTCLFKVAHSTPLWVLLSLAAASTAADAAAADRERPTHTATQLFHCGMTHFVRNAGTEIASTTITVRNADSFNSATIERLTVRDGQGRVLLDAGPAAGIALPLNTDFPFTAAGTDITQVPPGGTVYLRSNHIWGNDGLPPLNAAGNEVGQSLSATVQVAKPGRRNLVFVQATPRIRSRRLDNGVARETDTLASASVPCVALP